MKNLHTIIIILLFLVTDAHAGGLIGDMLDSLGGDLGKVGMDLDNAHKNMKELRPAYKSIGVTASQVVRDTSEKIAIDAARLEVHRKSEEIQQHLKMAETKLQEVDRKIEKLKILNQKMESDKAQFKKEHDRIVKEKADIEQREKLFSMGFYTTLATAFVVLVGLFLWILNSRLEKTKAIENKTQKRRATKIKGSNLTVRFKGHFAPLRTPKTE